MPRRVDRHERGPAIAQSGIAFGAAVGRALVDDEKHATCRAVGFLTHDLPAPERRAADSGDESTCQHFLAEIRQGPSGQRDTRVHGQLTHDPLDFNDDAGGKSGWPPASRLLIEAGEALVEEAVAPLADNLSRGIQARRDDIVGKPSGCQQDEPRADDVAIR